MTDIGMPVMPPLRAELEFKVEPPATIGDVAQPLGPMERLWNSAAVRRAVILAVLALIWEGYARWSDNPLLFPTFTETSRLGGRGSPPA